MTDEDRKKAYESIDRQLRQGQREVWSPYETEELQKKREETQEAIKAIEEKEGEKR